MMNISAQTKPKSLIIMAVIAFIFGVATLYSGGEVIFLDGAGRARAGDYIGFIVWFNFIAGFAYIAASYGIYGNKKWAKYLALLIFGFTLIVFLAFGIHIFGGGAYELRTVGAMILRSLVWLVFAFILNKNREF